MPQIRIAKRMSRKLATSILIAGVVIGVSAVVLWQQTHKPNLNNVYTIEAMVAKHYVLPQHETPVLATVTNKNNLTTPFLQEADNGDKILIYQKAKRVIIYRPSIDRIIDIGPVSIASS